MVIREWKSLLSLLGTRIGNPTPKQIAKRTILDGLSLQALTISSTGSLCRDQPGEGHQILTSLQNLGGNGEAWQVRIRILGVHHSEGSSHGDRLQE